MNISLLPELFIIPTLAWAALSLLALVSLRQRRLPSMTQAVWALIILLVPFLGAISFWIVRPTKNQTTP